MATARSMICTLQRWVATSLGWEYADKIAARSDKFHHSGIGQLSRRDDGFELDSLGRRTSGGETAT